MLSTQASCAGKMQGSKGEGRMGAKGHSGDLTQQDMVTASSLLVELWGTPAVEDVKRADGGVRWEFIWGRVSPEAQAESLQWGHPGQRRNPSTGALRGGSVSRHCEGAGAQVRG